MNEELSAWVDDELDGRTGEHLLNAVAKDDELRRAWDNYHLIGDVLRGTQAGGMARARFAARLAAEPTIVAPRLRPSASDGAAAAAAMATRAVRPTRWLASVAAGMAAVGFVGWVAWPGGPDPTRSVALVAPPPAAPSITLLAAPPLVAPPKGVANYLLAHQRWSPSYTMQGAAPYARLVADEGKGPQR